MESVQQASEQEIMQEMAKAMAEYAQQGGQNISSEEIMDTLEKLPSDDSEQLTDDDLTEQDKEVLELMGEFQRELARQNPVYVTRGALLKCQYGSHCRRLNLAMSHGVYASKNAVVHEDNCNPINGENISWFGVCQSPFNKTKGASILLEVDKTLDPNATGNIRGTPCIPRIVGAWRDTHAQLKIKDDTTPAAKGVREGTVGELQKGNAIINALDFVGDSIGQAVGGAFDAIGSIFGKKNEEPNILQDTSDTAQRDATGLHSAVTTISFLVCEHGGLIEVIESGQEYVDVDTSQSEGE